jgi:hypothetical protein
MRLGLRSSMVALKCRRVRSSWRGCHTSPVVHHVHVAETCLRCRGGTCLATGSQRTRGEAVMTHPSRLGRASKQPYIRDRSLCPRVVKALVVGCGGTSQRCHLLSRWSSRPVVSQRVKPTSGSLVMRRKGTKASWGLIHSKSTGFLRMC